MTTSARASGRVPPTAMRLVAVGIMIAALGGCSTVDDLAGPQSPRRVTVTVEEAEAKIDAMIEDVLTQMPQRQGTPLVVRTWGPATSACSPTTVQQARFVETEPLIVTTPDDLVNAIGATWKEHPEFDVREGPALDGTARAIREDERDGSSLVVSQWHPPLIQITAYSPCYPG